MRIRHWATVGLIGAGLTIGIGPLAWTQERFDHQVRNLIFAGMSGDAESLDKGIARCEAVLVQRPDHAEALVWHGSALLRRAGVARQQGNAEQSMRDYRQGLQEMDRAVKLAPQSVGVRVPRGATLLTATRFMQGNPLAGDLLRRAVEDYEAVLAVQETVLDSMGDHPKGELLFGLAEGHARLGNKEKAEAYFARLEKALPGSVYAKRAAIWREKGSLTPQESGCVGCHVQP